MIKRNALRRFIFITITTLILLTLMSTRWMPFNYPTASFQVVLYWQILDQLFIRHQYFFVFLFVSAILGLLFSIRLKGIYRKIQWILFYLLLFIWIWFMYFESKVA